MAVAGLVLAIFGLLLSWIPFVGWVGVLLAVIGLILGLLGMKSKKGLGIAASAIAAIGLVFGLYVQIKTILAAKEAVGAISAELDKPENRKALEEFKAAAAAAQAAAEAPAADKAPAAGDLKEIDLSAWGPAFKGYVAMAPAAAKIEFDDPSRFLHVSDDDYLKLGEAPFFEDGIAAMEKDPDNKNIVKLGATGATYERNPPLGKQWCFDYLVTVGKDKWSCSAESFTSEEVGKQLLEICKSIKKSGAAPAAAAEAPADAPAEPAAAAPAAACAKAAKCCAVLSGDDSPACKTLLNAAEATCTTSLASFKRAVKAAKPKRLADCN